MNITQSVLKRKWYDSRVEEIFYIRKNIPHTFKADSAKYFWHEFGSLLETSSLHINFSFLARACL